MRSRFYILVALTLWLWVALTARTASAQVISPENEFAARAAFAEGQRHFDEGNHQLALDAFQRMHDLMQGDVRAQAMVSYNIALCLDRLGRLEEALPSYDRFLAETPPDAPYRDRASNRVRELRSRAEFRASRQSETRGEDASSAEPEPATSDLSMLVPVGIVGTAMGAAVLFAAMPTGVLALDGEAHLESECPSGACAADQQARIDETRTLGVLTDILWVSGAVIAAASASLLLLGLMDGAEGTESARLSPEVACAPIGCMAGVRGRF